MGWTIYCHTHIESGRRYIGLTKQTMERRWASHVSKSRSAKGGRWHFPNAIRKYGPKAFSHEILAVCDTLEEANRIEREKIVEFKTRDPEFGFNLAEGGGSQPHPIRRNPWDDPEFRAKHIGCHKFLHTAEARANNKVALNTPESKAKRSAASKEVTSRPDVLAKISAAAAGRVVTKAQRQQLASARRGKKHSVETIAKIAEANKNIPEARRAKLSAASKRAWMRPEVRAKIVSANTGRRHSQETRSRIGAASKKFMQELRIERRRYVEVDGKITHKMCPHHGLVPVADCSIGMYKNGEPRVLCLKCSRLSDKKRGWRR